MSITRRILKHGHVRWEARVRRPDGKVVSRRFKLLADARCWKAIMATFSRDER